MDLRKNPEVGMMPLQREFKYEIVETILIISFNGEVNYYHHDELEKTLKSYSGKYSSVVIDMSNVTYINSLALNILVNISKMVNTRIVSSSSNFVSSVFKITKFDEFMNLCDTREEAIKSILEIKK